MDEKIIASVSGGKDSTAMCLHLQELDLPFRPVFMDTGWETAETYRYLREYLPERIGEITWLRSEVELTPELESVALDFERRLGGYSSMVRLTLKKAMFPSRLRRWCTEYLKTQPMRDFMRELDDDYINAVGIRAAESKSRSKLDEWEFMEYFDCDVWRPLIRWSEQDVIDIHTRHGIRPNPGYLTGATRVGCWPCIYAAKKELHHFSKDTERLQVLEDLEKVVGDLAEQKAVEKGTSLKERGHTRPAWFVNPFPTRDPVTGKRSGDCWPIRKVVEWARTKHGGRQFEMFLPPERERGCMRWGLCETHGE